MKRELKFTPKEMKVMKLLVKGDTNKEIASKLNNSVSTINQNFQTLRWKTKSKNKFQLCYFIGINGVLS